MFLEAINQVLGIWSGEPPYNLQGKYWMVSTQRQWRRRRAAARTRRDDGHAAICRSERLGRHFAVRDDGVGLRGRSLRLRASGSPAILFRVRLIEPARKVMSPAAALFADILKMEAEQ